MVAISGDIAPCRLHRTSPWTLTALDGLAGRVWAHVSRRRQFRLPRSGDREHSSLGVADRLRRVAEPRPPCVPSGGRGGHARHQLEARTVAFRRTGGSCLALIIASSSACDRFTYSLRDFNLWYTSGASLGTVARSFTE